MKPLELALDIEAKVKSGYGPMAVSTEEILKLVEVVRELDKFVKLNADSFLRCMDYKDEMIERMWQECRDRENE